MEMVGHQYKFVKQIFLFLAIVLQHVDEEVRHPLRLKQALLLKG
jgi:hypothetical protein